MRTRRTCLCTRVECHNDFNNDFPRISNYIGTSGTISDLRDRQQSYENGAETLLTDSESIGPSWMGVWCLNWSLLWEISFKAHSFRIEDWVGCNFHLQNTSKALMEGSSLNTWRGRWLWSFRWIIAKSLFYSLPPGTDALHSQSHESVTGWRTCVGVWKKLASVKYRAWNLCFL